MSEEVVEISKNSQVTMRDSLPRSFLPDAKEADWTRAQGGVLVLEDPFQRASQGSDLLNKAANLAIGNIRTPACYFLHFIDNIQCAFFADAAGEANVINGAIAI